MNQFTIIIRLLLTACLIPFMFSGCKPEEEEPEPVERTIEIRAADISNLPELRQSGLTLYNASNQPEDMLVTLKNAGINVIRLRLWHNPAEDISGFQSVKTLSDEVKTLGLKTWLTVHYSDSWADPGKQTKPALWANANFDSLKDSVYRYTKRIMQEINPAYIQIGNEINQGLLWPDGHLSNPAQLKSLLQSAVTAVREVNADTKIIMHYAGYEFANYLFNLINDIDYDFIGLSYYPFWHGKSLQALKSSMTTISNNAAREILIAETSYPFTLGWNDWTNNIIGLESQILPAFPATPQGQKAYMQHLRELIDDVPLGIGFCYWGAEWVSYMGSEATNGSPWENQACWDFDGKALPVLEAFNPPLP